MDVTFPDESTKTYIPQNIHFHAPSDHTLNGYHFDLEMHIVHIEKHTRQLGAVVAIMFDREKGGTKTNPFLKTLSPEFMNDSDKIVIVDKEYQTGYY